MKVVFVSAAACAFASLLSLLALSAMTVVPAGRPAQDQAILAAGLLAVAWGLLALWTRRRIRAGHAFPRWFTRVLPVVALAYALGSLALIFG